MGNCKSGLGVVHSIVDFTDEEQVKEALLSLLECDCDLTENEEYFQEDTIELGYENEAERIVAEAMKGVKCDNIETFNKLVERVSDSISNDDFWGACQLNTIQINDTQASLCFAYGGHED